MQKYISCHNGPVSVFSIGKAKIWASDYYSVIGDFNWKAIIRFGDNLDFFENPEFIRLNETAKNTGLNKLNDLVVKPDIADFRWPDFGVPWHFRKKFWEELYAYLATLQGDVLIHCVGGHGRTGTAMAILMGLHHNKTYKKPNPKYNPVKHLRKLYCKNVVETQDQIDYIRAITGLDFRAEAAEDWWMKAKKENEAQSVSTKSVTIDMSWHNNARKNATEFKLIGNSVYAKQPDGSLIYLQQDDGSFYGKAHAQPTDPTLTGEMPI